jgi:ZIP family zinc transporter
MNNTIITFFGIFFIFFCTTLGASVVYFFKNRINEKLNNFILGFSAGIMISASIWSLLIPALEQSEQYGTFKFMPAVIGFVLGGIFLTILGKIVPNFQPNDAKNAKNADFGRLAKLFVAITIHNIPEGLAVGFAFGSAATAGTSAAFLSALGLAIGIGLQNIPEGTAVALPISTITKSKHKAFAYGTASGAVEPIFALVGYFLASYIQVLQPWILSFSAGTMIFVVTEELIPESKATSAHYGTWGAMLGFALMMILDVVMA